MYVGALSGKKSVMMILFSNQPPTQAAPGMAAPNVTNQSTTGNQGGAAQDAQGQMSNDIITQ